MENMKKTLAIGIIVLFIGMALTPVISSSSIMKVKQTSKTTENSIPVEITQYQRDGKTSTATEELSAEDIQNLRDLVAALRGASNENEARDIVETFLSKTSGLGGLITEIAKGPLPGYNILSVGVGGKLRKRFFDIKVTPIKLVRLWRYTNFGVTLTTQGILPDQFLWGRQIGYMAGFFGVHLYIPAEFGIQGRRSFSLFIGHASLAGGISF